MPTVLVVDDERNIVELVRLYLAKEGYRVLVARDGQQAPERAWRPAGGSGSPQSPGRRVPAQAAQQGVRSPPHAGGPPRLVFSREQLLNQVWGYDFLGDTRTVDVHVARLRSKLAGTGVAIETVWGVGYKLVPE